MWPDPVPALKQQIGVRIAALLVGCPSYNACATLNTDASRVAELRRGQLKRFSLETLVRFAERLGDHVELTSESRRQWPGKR